MDLALTMRNVHVAVLPISSYLYAVRPSGCSFAIDCLPWRQDLELVQLIQPVDLTDIEICELAYKSRKSAWEPIFLPAGVGESRHFVRIRWGALNHFRSLQFIFQP